MGACSCGTQTRPFTKAQAAEIQRQKEIKEDLETIQVANMTEKSTTRGGKERQSSSKTETSSSKAENKAPVAMHAPPEVRVSPSCPLWRRWTPFAHTLLPLLSRRSSTDRWPTLLPSSTRTKTQCEYHCFGSLLQPGTIVSALPGGYPRMDRLESIDEP